jgi:hypothetical protein
MAWGEWMCPTLGPEHHLMLERERRAIAGYDLPQAQEMLRKTTQLMLHQELIIRGATRRIAELECREAVGGNLPQ